MGVFRFSFIFILRGRPIEHRSLNTFCLTLVHFRHFFSHFNTLGTSNFRHCPYLFRTCLFQYPGDRFLFALATGDDNAEPILRESGIIGIGKPEARQPCHDGQSDQGAQDTRKDAAFKRDDKEWNPREHRLASRDQIPLGMGIRCQRQSQQGSQTTPEQGEIPYRARPGSERLLDFVPGCR